VGYWVALQTGCDRVNGHRFRHVGGMELTNEFDRTDLITMRGKPHSAFPIYTDSVTSSRGTKHVSGLPSCGIAQLPLALNQRRKGGSGAARPSDAHIERS